MVREVMKEQRHAPYLDALQRASPDGTAALQRRPMRALRAVAVACLFVACTCEKKTGTEDVKPEANKPPLELKPLPKAPEIAVQQEPGPDAEALTVVAARPQGEVKGEVRPTVTFS